MGLRKKYLRRQELLWACSPIRKNPISCWHFISLKNSFKANCTAHCHWSQPSRVRTQAGKEQRPKQGCHAKTKGANLRGSQARGERMGFWLWGIRVPLPCCGWDLGGLLPMTFPGAGEDMAMFYIARRILLASHCE